MDVCLGLNSIQHDEIGISHRTTINVNQSAQSIFINGSSLSLNRCTHSGNLSFQEITNMDSIESFKLESVKCDQKVAEVDESNLNFNLNREQWQRRANYQPNIKISQTLKSNRSTENWLHRKNHTPDLVMDLPLVKNSNLKGTLGKSISVSSDLYSDNTKEKVTSNSDDKLSEPESPDMTTAAERFAKQNQCTLKKNTKINMDLANKSDMKQPISDLVVITTPTPDRKYIVANTNTTSFKPQLKTKPPVLKKPIFSVTSSTGSTNTGNDQNMSV